MYPTPNDSEFSTFDCLAYCDDYTSGHPLAGPSNPACIVPCEDTFSVPLLSCPVQLSTPLPSRSTSPVLEGYPATEEIMILSLSTAFHPGAHAVDPDTIFASSDGVLFHLHLRILKKVSPRAFSRVFEMHRWAATAAGNKSAVDRPALYSEGIIYVPETSAVLNIILHVLYGMSPAHHSPSFETLMAAVNRMPSFDLNPKDYIVPHTSLFELLLSHAPLFPLRLYTLAGHHDLQDLAIQTSSHLLSYPLSNITEEMAEEMGVSYLKRLLCLRLNRFDALKEILLQPLHPHPPTKECGFVNQKQLMRVWGAVLAHQAWDDDVSVRSIQDVLSSLEHLSCALCRECLQKRIKEVVVQWANVKRTV